MILNSAIVEVIIGMVFVYSLLSILVTQINMVIVNVLNLRARHLKQAIKDMLSDPNIQAKFLTHPLISLVKRPLDPNRQLSAQGAEKIVESNTTDVAWIEPAVFADVMIDLVSAQTGVERDLYAPLLRVANTVLDNAERAQVNVAVRMRMQGQSSDDELRAVIMNLQDPAHQEALLQPLNEIQLLKHEFRTESPDMIALLRGLRSVQNEDFQRALDTLLTTAQNIEEAKNRLEQWFDNSMNQVTDNYRRYMQYISLGVGLALAVLLNVDTLQVAETLWNDPALRGAVAVTARASLESGELASQLELVEPQKTDVVIDAEASAAEVEGADGVIAEATPDANVTGEDVAEAQRRLNESVEATVRTVDNLLELRLPIGWGYAPVPLVESRGLLPLDPFADTRNLWNFWPGNNAGWLGLLVKKIIGIALTTLAVSQGAPFWFDLLNRIARGGKSS